MADSAGSAMPAAADSPSWSDDGGVLAGNSPNHGGWGQNVLFTDGHVRWHHTRSLGPHDLDMYLNADRLPAPGISERDAMLAPGPFRLDGQP